MENKTHNVILGDVDSLNNILSEITDTKDGVKKISGAVNDEIKNISKLSSILDKHNEIISTTPEIISSVESLISFNTNDIWSYFDNIDKQQGGSLKNSVKYINKEVGNINGLINTLTTLYDDIDIESLKGGKNKEVSEYISGELGGVAAISKMVSGKTGEKMVVISRGGIKKLNTNTKNIKLFITGLQNLSKEIDSINIENVSKSLESLKNIMDILIKLNEPKEGEKVDYKKQLTNMFTSMFNTSGEGSDIHTLIADVSEIVDEINKMNLINEQSKERLDITEKSIKIILGLAELISKQSLHILIARKQTEELSKFVESLVTGPIFTLSRVMVGKETLDKATLLKKIVDVLIGTVVTVSLIGVLLVNPLVWLGMFLLKTVVNKIFDVIIVISQKQAEANTDNNLRLLMKISLSFLTFAASLALLSLIITNWGVLIGVGLMVGMVMLSVGLLIFLGKQNKKIKDNSKILLSIGATFLLFALSIVLVSLVSTNPAAWQGYLAFAAMVGISIGLLAVLGTIKKFAKDSIEVLLTIGATFLLFALSIVLVSLVSTNPAAWQGYLAFAAMVGVAVGIILLIGLLDKKLKQGSSILKGIGVMFLLFAVTVVLLALVGVNDDAWKGYLAFFALVAMAVGVLWVISTFKKPIRDGNTTLRDVGIAFLLFAITVIMLSCVGVDQASGFLTFAGIVLVAVGVLWVISKMDSSKGIEKGAKALLILSVAFIVFIAVTALVSLLDIQTGFGNFFALGVIIAILAVGLYFLSENSSKITQGSLMLMLMGAAILVFMIPLVIITKLNMDGAWEKFGLVAASLVLFAGAMAVLGIPPVAAFVGLGAAVILIMGAALIVYSNALKKITNINTSTLKKNIPVLVSSIGELSNAVIGISLKSLLIIPGAVTLGVLGVAVQSLAEGLIKVQEAGNFNKNSLLGVVEPYIELVKSLKSNKDLSKRAINQQVKKIGRLGKISRTLAGMVDTVVLLADMKVATKWDEKGNPIEYKVFDPKGDGARATANATIIVGMMPDIVSKVAEIDFGEAKIAEKIGKKLGPICGALSDMVDIVVKMASGVVPNEIDTKTGEVTSWKKFSEISMGGITTGLNSMIKGFVEAITTSTLGEEGEKTFWGKDKKWKNIEKNMASLSTCLDPINTMVDAAMKISSGKPSPLFTEGDTTLKNIIKNYCDAVIEFDIDVDHKNIGTSIQSVAAFTKILKEQADIDFNKQSKGQESFIKNNIKFLDKVSTVDINKVKTVKDMIAEMSRFSESINGNFEELAKVLQDKILDILEKLKTSIDGIGNQPKVSQPKPVPTQSVTSASKTPKSTDMSTSNSGPSIDLTSTNSNIQDVTDAIASLEQLIRAGIKIKE